VSSAIREGRWRAPIIQQVIRQFHTIYYLSSSRTWANTRWLGTRLYKCPLDLWIYQEILHEVRPDVIVETGTKFGGSAYYLASICDLLGRGEVITIDIEALPDRPRHPRIRYVTGSSTDPDVVARIDALVNERQSVLVILDSDHSRQHVLEELDAWHSRVSLGSYLIVEDTHMNGHPVVNQHGPGPWEALAHWLPQHPEFVRDKRREKFLLTFNPRGYLKRVA